MTVSGRCHLTLHSSSSDNTRFFIKLRGHLQYFSPTRSKKMLQHFFFGKCYSRRLLATCCNFRLLQQKNIATLLQKISLILLQFICKSFNVLQHNFFLRNIFSRGPYVQHIFAANTTVILSYTYVYDFINNNGFSRRKHEID